MLVWRGLLTFYWDWLSGSLSSVIKKELLVRCQTRNRTGNMGSSQFWYKDIYSIKLYCKTYSPKTQLGAAREQEQLMPQFPPFLCTPQWNLALGQGKPLAHGACHLARERHSGHNDTTGCSGQPAMVCDAMRCAFTSWSPVAAETRQEQCLELLSC